MGTQQIELDDLRARLHGMWAAVAGAWAEHAEYADTRRAQVVERMLDLTTPRPGERVLELACGPGGLGLAAAGRVAPDGEVVQSDVAAEMIAIAAARAAALGITGMRTRVLDLEHIAEPDCSYDVVLCSEGLMFAPDPSRGAREIRRVLRPGGRVALTVWGPRELNPWLGIVFDAVGAQLGRPVPPPGVPGPFSLADRYELSRLLGDAGLVDVEVGELAVPLRAALALGLGVAFLAYGLPSVRRFVPPGPDRAVAVYVTIAWLLVSWYPHGGLHASNGMDTGPLLWIEYGFHIPLVVAPLVLIWAVAGRRSAHAGDPAQVGSTT